MTKADITIKKHPKNNSNYHELWCWRLKSKRDYDWVLCGRGSKEQMLWVMKVMMAMLISITGPPKRPEEFLYLVAQYLVLSPDNKPVPIPQLCEIKSPFQIEKGTSQVDIVLEMLDKMPPIEVCYEGRL